MACLRILGSTTTPKPWFGLPVRRSITSVKKFRKLTFVGSQFELSRADGPVQRAAGRSVAQDDAESHLHVRTFTVSISIRE